MLVLLMREVFNYAVQIVSGGKIYVLSLMAFRFKYSSNIMGIASAI
jgi:hypothetical protein